MVPVPKKVFTPGTSPKTPGRPKKKRVNFSRKGNYRSKYTEEDMRKALKAVKNKRMSLGEASKEYGVPKVTIHDRLRGNMQEKLGRPTVLSEEEESIIVERLKLMGTWGFPLTSRDLCAIIKAYLDELGRTTRNKKLPIGITVPHFTSLVGTIK